MAAGDGILEALQRLEADIEGIAHEYKAESYSTFADYETGLANETGAGWVPIATTNFVTALSSEILIVTYRRPLP